MRVLKRAAIISIAFTAFICLMLSLFASGILDFGDTEAEAPVFTAATNLTDAPMLMEESEEGDELYLSLELPAGYDTSKIEIVNDYRERILLVTFPDLSESYLSEHPLRGTSGHIASVDYAGRSDGLMIQVTYDTVFEYETGTEGSFYYIYPTDPHELYDKIVVIDPGHGGLASPGAEQNGYKEADIDFQIGKYLFDILSESDIKVYTTRISDVYVGLGKRISLANDLNADMFVSIHCNTNGLDYMDSSAGTTVLYNDTDTSGLSYALGEVMLDQLSSDLGTRARGVVKGSDIYVLRNAQVPAVLVEVGFMSNQEELNNLVSASYQKRVAQSIYEAIVRAYEEVL